jgi:hypothetical protein
LAIPFRCRVDGAETALEALGDEAVGAAGGSEVLNILRTRLRCPHVWNGARLQRGPRSEARKNSDPRQFECEILERVYRKSSSKIQQNPKHKSKFRKQKWFSDIKFVQNLMEKI